MMLYTKNAHFKHVVTGIFLQNFLTRLSRHPSPPFMPPQQLPFPEKRGQTPGLGGGKFPAAKDGECSRA